MTSTGTFKGLGENIRSSSKVLKPPGGGSSDIFGSGPEETSPRRIKNHNQSQLGSALFDSTPSSQSSQSSINGGADTPRCNKPGNDSYNRLFGPPPPVTPKSKTHMRSNITLSNGVENKNGSSTNHMVTSPAKSTSSYNSTTSSSSLDLINGHSVDTNQDMYNDVIDPNPVTGTGYPSSDPHNNGPAAMSNGQQQQQQQHQASSPSSNSSGGEKSNDSCDAARPAPAARTRVPPGGYSSGLW